MGGILARQPWAAIERFVPAAADGRVERLVQLRRFVELLLQWNRRVSNLISKNDESRVVEAHLVPSLEPAEWIASHRLSRWLDFGSGGGFPAIPLALCGVGEHWDLVESR
ncbi:MAG TPA: RsmG family class I SAM-dependent methyltransferase, partial [Candidatus Sulfotelmatobacter sp.]|nr:RsmG family class I SAM-dependent methyltransferase [Candidatus Sulfotelmatobacter sp.]